ncbi:hypothetical protein VULLAG_LOCUS2731 [Vulpes lagopus]
MSEPLGQRSAVQPACRALPPGPRTRTRHARSGATSQGGDAAPRAAASRTWRS